MVEAVPIVMQCPCERCMHDSASWNSSSVILPARRSSDIDQTLVPEPMSCAAVLAGEHRPAGDADGRAGRRSPRPSAATAWSCRSPPAARRRRADCRGSIPRRPCWRGCGRASRWAAAASRRATSPGIRAGSRRLRGRRCCTCSASTRKCVLQGVSSDQVLQMPITGRPSNWSCGTPRFFIQLR